MEPESAVLNFALGTAPRRPHHSRLVDLPGHAAAALVAYLMGSIPTGYLVARARGVDIRAVGSGNIGATNVFRALGRTAGTAVLAMDLLKGLLACTVVIAWAGRILHGPNAPAPAESYAIVAGVSAVLGHNYTCWLRFKGGKGIATSAGVLIAIVPAALIIILAVWVLIFALTRYVSLASVAASLSLPPATWLTEGSTTMILITSGLTTLALYKHRANIRRLLQGTEHRVGESSSPSEP